MASTDPRLTRHEMKKMLEQKGPLLLDDIDTNDKFLAHLVSAEAITSLQSENIRAIVKIDDKKQELLDIIGKRLESFISFCIILHELGKDDIVRDEFGLNIRDLKCQKKEIEQRREEEKKENMRLDQLAKQKQAANVSSSTAQRTVEPVIEDQVDAQPMDIEMNAKMPILHPYKPQPEDTAMDVGHGVAAACLPPLFRKLIKEHGFVPNKIMKDDLQHMVDVLNTATRIPKVLIAVLDSGIWAEHPRLKNSMVKRKNAPTDNDIDDENHGTIMAGILVEFAGICIEIVNFKIGGNTLDYLQAGLHAIKGWEVAASRQVDIILTSHNATETKYTVKDDFDKILTDLAEERILICSASNKTNDSDDVVRYPATHPLVLGIGSRNIKGKRSDFSTEGHALNFLFPGERFISTSRPPLPDETGIKLFDPPKSADDWMTETERGTSFASPHCAAAAAIILSYTELTLSASYREGLTRTKTMEELLIEVCSQKFKVETGYGYPQLKKINSTMIKEKVDGMCKKMKVKTTLPL